MAIFLCFSSSFQLPGQQLHLVLKNYTTDHGLPSPEVYDILQDRHGFIWFSTDNGVSRFDGYSFKNYGGREGLMHPVVLYMQEDIEGRIWMATLSGNMYIYVQDSIKIFAYNDVIQRFRQGRYQVDHFFVDSLLTVHLKLTNLGFLAIDKEGHHQLLAEELPCGVIFYQNGKQELSNYIHSASKKEGDTRERCNDPRFLIDRFALSFFEDSIKERLLLPFPNGMPMKDQGVGVAINDSTHFLVIGRQGYIFERQVPIWSDAYPYRLSAFLLDDQNKILLGNDQQGGLRVYDGIEDIIGNRYQTYLKGYTVSHILKDRRGDYWFSTTENGIYYAPNREMKVLNKDSGLPTANVTAICPKSPTELFIGLRNGDIYFWDLEHHTLLPLPTSKSEGQIYQLTYDSINQRLWKGASQLQYLDDNIWKPILFSKDGKIMTHRANKAFVLDQEIGVLYGCNSGYSGVSTVNMKTAEMPEVSKSTLGRNFCIFKDQDKRILVGRQMGLFEIKRGELVKVPLPLTAPNGRIEDIDQLSNGALVLATKGKGLVLWGKGGYQIIDSKHGLASDLLEKVHVDHNQNIWVGTLNGLNQLTPKDSTFTNFELTTYDISNGLPSNEINAITSLGNQVWVGTTRGLVKIPEKLQSPSTLLVPTVDEVLVNNQPSGLEKLGHLKHFENSIRLSFLSFNYRLGNTVNYRYRITNTEPWSYTKERTINYSSLESGSYAFEIQMKDEDGNWSPSRQLKIKIYYPIWEHHLFQFTVVGLLALFLWKTYQNKLNQLEKVSATEKEINRLKQSALRAQMNPHFIFNCLNAVQQASMKGEQLKVAEYLARFAQLVRLVMDSTLAETISLAQEVQILENYLELEKIRLNDKLDYEINIDGNLDPSNISLPPLLVQPYVENAILHGLQDSSKQGYISIRYERKERHLLILIRDNGIGITESQRRRVSIAKGTHKSVGMSLTAQRLDLSDAASNSSIMVKEIKDELGSVLGTLVQLKISWEVLHVSA